MAPRRARRDAVATPRDGDSHGGSHFGPAPHPVPAGVGMGRRPGMGPGTGRRRHRSPGRRLCRGRAGGHRRAPVRTPALARTGPQRDRRQPPWRRRAARRGGGGQGGSRWRDALLRGQPHADHQPPRDEDDGDRSGHGPDAGVAGAQLRQRAGHQQGSADQVAGGVDRLRQGPPGQGGLRLGRHGRLQPLERRALRQAGRRPAHACALQGQRPGDDPRSP
jgi:hypothetical protein